MPLAGLLKFQVSRCHPEAEVVASVSTARLMSVWFSTFKRITCPEADAQTFALIVMKFALMMAEPVGAKNVTPDQPTFPFVVFNAV